MVLAFAVGLVGVPFGVLATTAGLSFGKAMVMSLLVFTGASQFAAVGVLDAGGSPFSAVGSALLLGARNSLYGIRLSGLLAPLGLRRVVASQLVIDESTAMSVAQTVDRSALEAFWWTGLGVYFFWNSGTALGAWLGDLIGDPETWGLDVAFPASFVALVGSQLTDRPSRAAAIAGVVIALVAVPFSPSGLPILLAAFAVVPGLAIVNRGLNP